LDVGQKQVDVGTKKSSPSVEVLTDGKARLVVKN
jgi:hypothetical protein